MNPREFFSRRIEIDATFKDKDMHIDQAVQFIREEYGIETTSDEIMIEIKTSIIPSQTPNIHVTKHFLILEPTQTLLKKFLKDYPEFLI